MSTRHILPLLIALALLSGCTAKETPQTPTPPLQINPVSPAPAPLPPPRKPLTQFELETIRYGMTLEQVEAKLAREADRVKTEYDKGIKGYTSPSLTAWHYWDNDDGTGIRVGFISNVVAEKEVIGSDNPTNTTN